HGWYSWAPKLAQMGSRHISFGRSPYYRPRTALVPPARREPCSSALAPPHQSGWRGQASVDSVAVQPAAQEPPVEEVPVRESRIAPEPATQRQSGMVTRLLGLVDQAVVSAVGLFTAVVLWRLAGQEALGLYSLGFTLVVIATAILSSLTSLP